MSTEYTRGEARGRMGARRVLLWAGAALAVVVVAGIVLAAIFAPDAVKPECPADQQCGAPPTAPALVVDEVFRSPGLGYSFEYSSKVLGIVEQDARSIVLDFEKSDARLIVEAVPAAEATPEQALQGRVDAFSKRVLGLTDDTDPAHQILGPVLASRNGLGRTVSGNVDSAQGVGTKVAIAMMAAGDNDITMVASVITGTSDEDARKGILGYADHVLNTLRFPGDAEANAEQQAGQPGAATKGTSSPVPLGDTDPGTKVAFSLVLDQRRGPELRRYLREIQDPSSEHYRDFLTAEEFGARFGVSPKDISRVSRVLASHDLRVTSDYPQRTALDVQGTAAAVGRFLGVRFVDYLDGDGTRFRAPVGEPVLPRSVRGPAVAATGLSTRPYFREAALPAGGLKPKDAAAAYNVAPLHKAGFQGQGQTIAIISLDSFHDEDIAAYDKQVGIKDAPPVEHVPVKGGTRPGPGQDEVNLDIDVIRGLAPKAKILDYEAPNTEGSVAAIVNQIVADNRVEIASLSWGLCSLLIPEAERLGEEQALKAAVAQGITVFVASGDSGAYECQRIDPTDQRLSIPWPAGSSDVVSVGGTTLSVRQDGRYLEEAGWEYVLSGSGGGGGLEPKQARPPWQKGIGVDNADTTGARQAPDVSANADPYGGWFTYHGGYPHEVGGTSAAAPFWAASMLLIDQKAKKENAGKLGFVAPILYELAAQGDSPFHDVVRGGNRRYDADPGWDYSTGLGSPDVAKLADKLVAFLKQK